jgi:cytidylate kinase
MIIAIDGPSGAGKSTLGKRLAKELGLLYLDTGAMYRAVALALLERGIVPDDAARAVCVAEQSNIELSGEPDNLHVFLNGREISEEIRTPQVSQAASIVSTAPEVRRILVAKQQSLGNRGAGCVLEGRDIGTIVFPHADVKIFLTAAAESRAARRYSELLARGEQTDFEKTLSEIIERDQRDETREDSPLKVAGDAVLIDSTDSTTEEVFARMLSVVREKQKSQTAREG